MDCQISSRTDHYINQNPLEVVLLGDLYTTVNLGYTVNNYLKKTDFNMCSIVYTVPTIKVKCEKFFKRYKHYK